jgi:predicted enzyme related to lactoylglutathione lyase
MFYDRIVPGPLWIIILQRGDSKGMNQNLGMKLFTYPVQDIAQAKKFYRQLLGVEPYADAPYYVGFRIGEHEIGLVPNGQKQGMTGPLGYFQVSDIRNCLKSLVEAGAQVDQQARDVGGGRLVASVKDADGNIIGLFQDP